MASKYKVLLPKTKFPLRANPAASDPAIRAAANFDELYKWQQVNRKTSPTFTLHDGPPYANGSPHMGHALNKILKDIINRYKLLRGFRIEYRPGWDCHGLPIELKACRDSDFVGRPAREIRSKAASFAKSALNLQREEFRSWGCVGDWDHPYLTMDKAYEAEQIGVFHQMYKKGCIYRGFKPVYWSPSSKTALAEAELEYKEHVSASIYTLFPLMPSSLDFPGEISALVWTTTPWTLVANRAICYHPEHSYSLIEVQHNGTTKVLLVGSKCLESLSHVLGEHRVLRSLPGSELSNVRYKNPVKEEGGELRFLPAGHVSDEEGTGLVHTAPSHGYDDYGVGLQHGLDLHCVVDGEGRYTHEVGAEFEGMSVLHEGNQAVLAKLRGVGVSLHEHSYSHRYPYDWRTKKPVIIRATNQWFASVRSLKEQAKKAVTEDVTMYPSVSRNRLLNFLDGRDDWCISRQRLWGVPLPIFYSTATDEPLVSDETILHVKKLFGQFGSDCWWELSEEELLPKSLVPEAGLYRKGKDTMDVWFDSGSSWASVLKRCGSEGVADLYLEGSDQHRGWFQSSLLTSVAVRGRAPYRAVLTHGFVLDKAGDKMSKSVGNIISPADILTTLNFGADVMRLWVASSDYYRDVQLSDTILKQNSDFLQRIRNICRFLLGNLSNFDPSTDIVPYPELSKLDKYALHILSEYNHKTLSAYNSFEFSGVHHALSTFLPNDLSSFYFDIVKDCLYCDEEESRRRRSTVTTLYHLLKTIVLSVAPIAPHLAEEVAQHAPFQGEAESREHREWFYYWP